MKQIMLDAKKPTKKTKKQTESPTKVPPKKNFQSSLSEWLAKDAVRFPREKYSGLLILWITLVVILLLKGGKGLESAVGIKFCDGGYWGMTGVSFAWLFGFSVYYGMKVVRNSRFQGRLGGWLLKCLLWDASGEK
jgi:hypothetical protein